MKKTMILAAAALCCACGSDKYTIEGSLEGLSGTIYLFDQGNNLLDSAAVENSGFRFKGRVEQPQVVSLSDAREPNLGTFGAMLILEPGRIVITDDAEHADRKHATGTPANDALDAYSTTSQALVTEFRSVGTSSERRKAIEEEYSSLGFKALEENRDNLFGVLMLARQSYDLSGRQTLDQIDLFTPEMQQTATMQELRTQAEQRAKSDVGQSYTDIAQPDAEGETVTLQSVVENPANKLTLVDFWASWCGPCMGEVPHLKKTYDAFHGKGFEIYGVSFDHNRDSWLAAVGNNGMEWIHVSELKGFDNQAARDYAVQGIPSNFLIDAEGKIVATNLRGEALYEKIASLLE